MFQFLFALALLFLFSLKRTNPQAHAVVMIILVHLALWFFGLPWWGWVFIFFCDAAIVFGVLTRNGAE